MAAQKFTNFDKLFLDARWYDSCHTMQSNKIVSNDIKDN